MSLTQLGHYLARRMAHGLKNVSWSKLMRSWVEESDKLIVDWGLKKIGTLRVTRHRTSYTSLLKARQHEMTVAIQDHFCTKMRWIVESYHMNYWRLFKYHSSFNSSIKVIADLVKIVNECLNHFRGPSYK
jgi:hypothetical protein